MRITAGAAVPQRVAMSNLIVRLLLSILMIPLAIILFIVVVVSMEQTLRMEAPIVAGSASWVFIAIYWIALWRDAVRWDFWRKVATLIAAVLSALTAMIVAVVLDNIAHNLGTVIGSLTAPLLWLVSTLLIWRETSTERVERLRAAGSKVLVCPACGYNLTGLREVRCPECGMQMTLDELIAAQPTQGGAELEDAS